jgi:MFS family permease
LAVAAVPVGRRGRRFAARKALDTRTAIEIYASVMQETEQRTTEALAALASIHRFCVIETRVAEPMFHLDLFRIRAFAAGNIASLLSSIGRGGLQFMLIIWLQGIWLPLHGYSFERTPLWAGIYMLPLTAGFMLAGPLSGKLSDRHGARGFATVGMLLTAVTFGLLMLLPANFSFPVFGGLLLLNGIGTGLFAAPNMTGIMNSAPADQRGAASGMRATFQNTGMVLSIGVFFSLMIVGLSASLPHAMATGLQQQGVSVAKATEISHVPAVGSLFAAFLGYNPMQKLLGSPARAGITQAQWSNVTGKTFFPRLISHAFINGLRIAFTASLIMSLIAAAASWMRGAKYVHRDEESESDVGPFGAPLSPDADLDEAPEPEEWVPA